VENNILVPRIYGEYLDEQRRKAAMPQEDET